MCYSVLSPVVAGSTLLSLPTRSLYDALLRNIEKTITDNSTANNVVHSVSGEEIIGKFLTGGGRSLVVALYYCRYVCAIDAASENVATTVDRTPACNEEDKPSSVSVLPPIIAARNRKLSVEGCDQPKVICLGAATNSEKLSVEAATNSEKLQTNMQKLREKIKNIDNIWIMRLFQVLKR
jgi:hypothetical protein